MRRNPLIRFKSIADLHCDGNQVEGDSLAAALRGALLKGSKGCHGFWAPALLWKKRLQVSSGHTQAMETWSNGLAYLQLTMQRV